MTELMGSATMEKREYQGVASITSREWRQHTVMNGTLGVGIIIKSGYWVVLFKMSSRRRIQTNDDNFVKE